MKELAPRGNGAMLPAERKHAATRFECCTVRRLTQRFAIPSIRKQQVGLTTHPGAPESVLDQKGASPFQACALRPVTEGYLFSALGGSEDRFLGRLTPLDRLALCCPDGFPGMIFRSFLPQFADSY